MHVRAATTVAQKRPFARIAVREWDALPASVQQILLELDGECRALRRRVATLEHTVAAKDQRIAALRKKIALLEQKVRDGARQAGPFRRRHRKPKSEHRRSGRPVGHSGAHQPTPTHVDERASAPLEQCPHCGGQVEDVHDIVQFILDLPEIRAKVLRLMTQSGWCPKCRRHVRTTHPRQTSTATGAASVSIGPRALALATELKDTYGMPYRDIAEMMRRFFGIRVTHGALVQSMARLGDGRAASDDYDVLMHALRNTSVVYCDDTGWRIGVHSAWLWVFTAPGLTLYAIHRARGHQVVIDALGADFRGTLVSDGLPALDALDSLGFRRAQCNAHILARVAKLEPTPRAEIDGRLLARVKELFERIVTIAHIMPALEDIKPALIRSIRQRLNAIVRTHTTDVELSKLLRHLAKHRDMFLRCLDDPAIEPTNNRSEQALRYAVILRKIGGCHRSEIGARSHAKIASVARTARQHGETLEPFIQDWMKARRIGARRPPIRMRRMLAAANAPRSRRAKARTRAP